jgi:acetyl esterase/lipase
MKWQPIVYEVDLPFGQAQGKTLLLDIVRPKMSPPTRMPAIISIHGGGWRGGRKRPQQSAFLAQRGFFTVSITYRLSQEAPFPACLSDCKAAVRWLRANADRYHLDPERIGVWGHSAGAHLAALLGTTGDLPLLEGASGSPGYSSRVQAVAVFAVPADFLLPTGGWLNAPAVRELFAGTPEQRAEAMRLASPLTHLHGDVTPFLIVHGVSDTVIPIEQGRRLYEALSQRGCQVTFVPVRGKGHHFSLLFPLLNPISRMLLAFFERHLRGTEGESVSHLTSP